MDLPLLEPPTNDRKLTDIYVTLMWILDLQLPTEGQDLRKSGSRSYLLRPGKMYTLGRDVASDFYVNIKKISRKQMQIVYNEKSNSVQLLNIGNGNWVDSNGTELTGRDPKARVIRSDTSFKLRSFDWKIEFFKVPDLKISSFISSNVKESLDLEVDRTLADKVISINGHPREVKTITPWLETIRSRRWETKGRLHEYLIPSPTTEVTTSSDSSQEDENSHGGLATNGILREEKTDMGRYAIKPSCLDSQVHVTKNKVGQTTAATRGRNSEDLIDIRPPRINSNFCLNRKVEKSKDKKSQFDLMLDEMEEIADLDTYISQNTQKNKRESLGRPSDEHTDVCEVSSVSERPIDKFNAELLNLDIDNQKHNLYIDQGDKKRRGEAIPNPDVPLKRLKSGLMKQETPISSNDKLTDIFKKTKRLKLNKLGEEEKLMHEASKHKAKVTPFKLKILDRANPRVYTNYNTSLVSEPSWQDRLNYSNFKKNIGSSSYNPIMDSTIKTIRFKCSNYKSNEYQVNLDQNDDMIPDLDVMFDGAVRNRDLANSKPNALTSSSNIPFANSHKRRREPALFVESDYEDTQENTQDLLNGFHKIDTTNARKNIAPVDILSTPRPAAKTQPNSLDDKDDTPVFKSRRRQQ